MDVPVIAVTAELDMASVDEFREAVAQVPGAPERILVDLTETPFIDSMGLSALIEVHHELRSGGRGLALVAPRGTPAAQLLTLTQLRPQLPTYESRAAALDA